MVPEVQGLKVTSVIERGTEVCQLAICQYWVMTGRDELDRDKSSLKDGVEGSNRCLWAWES